MNDQQTNNINLTRMAQLKNTTIHQDHLQEMVLNSMTHIDITPNSQMISKIKITTDHHIREINYLKNLQTGKTHEILLH